MNERKNVGEGEAAATDNDHRSGYYSRGGKTREAIERRGNRVKHLAQGNVALDSYPKLLHCSRNKLLFLLI